MQTESEKEIVYIMESLYPPSTSVRSPSLLKPWKVRRPLTGFTVVVWRWVISCYRLHSGGVNNSLEKVILVNIEKYKLKNPHHSSPQMNDAKSLLKFSYKLQSPFPPVWGRWLLDGGSHLFHINFPFQFPVTIQDV